MVVESIRYVRWHTAVPPAQVPNEAMSAETDLPDELATGRTPEGFRDLG
jgi:hypothetical protein